MANYDESEGVWRTVGGRRIFIKKGQDLADAMIQSGKFKNLRSDYRKAKEEEKTKNEYTSDELKEKYSHSFPYHEKTEKEKEYAKAVAEYFKGKDIKEEVKKVKEENERLEIAKDIAKEVYGKNMGEELLERKAREILEPQEGEVLEEGDKPYTNAKGELERSTKYLKEWQEQLKGNKETKNEEEKKETYEDYVKRTLNNEDYLRENRPNEYFQKTLRENNVKTFADEIKENENKTKKALGRGLNDLGNEKLDGEGVKKLFGENENKSSDWKSQIEKNNAQMEKDVTNIQNQINDFRNRSAKETDALKKYQYLKEADRLQNQYYERFRENERANAKIKVEEPNEKYMNIEAYAGYKDKFNKTWGKDGQSDKVVSAKMYTNDEFMEHLEDANWHSERTQLLKANLTNQELSYIKDRTKVSAWGVENLTGKEQVSKLIEEAKNKSNSISNSLQKKAYQKYMKEHPGSKMTFEDYKKQK